MKEKGIAFFDFDGTLTSKDSFGLFAKHSVGTMRYLISVLLSIPDIILWKSGKITNSKAKQRLFSRLYKGRSKAWFENKGVSFSSIIDSHLNDTGMSLLQEHISAGDDICIVTASLSTWIVPWAHKNGIMTVIATEPEFDDKGNLTGKFATPNCHGKEKVERIKDLLSLSGGRYYKATAYGDSKSDMEMINYVGRGKLI